MTQQTTDPEKILIRLADELRAMSNAGIMFTDDPYQIARFHRIIEIAAELVHLVDGRSLPDLHEIFFEDLHYITPYSVVDTAVFDEAGRLLLIQRADNGKWALPGGACDVDELPSTGAAREVWEETGYVVEVTDFIGIFDNRFHGGRSIHHLYCLLFAGRVVGGSPLVTLETRDVRWFPPDAIPWDHLSGTHSIRIAHALRWHADPSTPVHFDRDDWKPTPTWQHERKEAKSPN